MNRYIILDPYNLFYWKVLELRISSLNIDILLSNIIVLVESHKIKRLVGTPSSDNNWKRFLNSIILCFDITASAFGLSSESQHKIISFRNLFHYCLLKSYNNLLLSDLRVITRGWKFLDRFYLKILDKIMSSFWDKSLMEVIFYSFSLISNDC